MTCRVCGTDDLDLRMQVCFDCATAGDLRLGRRSTLQHWLNGIRHAFGGYWVYMGIDFKCGWQRIWRSGDYAPGGEWEHL